MGEFLAHQLAPCYYPNSVFYPIKQTYPAGAADSRSSARRCLRSWDGLMFYVRRRLVVILSVLIAIVGVSVAEAAAVRVGPTIGVYVLSARGNAVAYDSVNNVYLVVSSHASLPGSMYGSFTDKNGNPVGAPFKIQASVNSAHFPRVAFAPQGDAGAGAFLVTWHESDLPGSNTSIHGRMVSYTKGGPAGADNMLAPDGSWWEAGPAVTYGVGSQEFLVVWRRLAGNDIRAVRVGLDGAAKAAAFNITASVEYEDNPSVAYSPTANVFLVAYSGYSDAGHFAFVDARLVQGGTGQLLGASAARIWAGSASFITDTTYIGKTNQYLVAWYDGTTSLGHLVAGDGTPTGNTIPLSGRWAANDALSVAYNPLTETAMLVSHNRVCDAICVEDGGVEITTAGAPVDNGFQITAAGGTGNFYPRIAASTNDPSWLVSTAHNFTMPMSQLVTGTTVAAPAPQISSNPLLSIDTPRAGILGQPIWFAGWAADLGSTKDSGADAVHVWAWPDSGAAPIFAGAVMPNSSRPDVGNAFGARFTSSGYGLLLNTLPGGSYTLVAYMHSTVTGTFATNQMVHVTITAPLLAIDTPVANQTVAASGFMLGGWAIDRGAAAGTGIDTLHVWAWPTNGAPPIWAGVATMGGARADIGSIFGPQFLNAGYNVWISSVPPGVYNFIVYGHSALTGTFSVATSVVVIVQ